MAEELPQPILHRCSHCLSRAETLKEKKKDKERGETRNAPGRAGQSEEKMRESEGQRTVSNWNMGISLCSWPPPLRLVSLLSAVQWRAESKVEACKEALLYTHTHCERVERDAMSSHDLLFSSTLTWLPGKPVKRRRRVG